MTIRAIRQYPRVKAFETLKDAEAYLRKLLVALQEEAVVVSTLYRTFVEGIMAGTEFSVIEMLDSLPDAGTAGRLVYLTTDGKLYIDNGSVWLEVIGPEEVQEHLGGEDDPLVDTGAIADAAVETAKIANAAIEAAKIATGAATEAKIGAGAITVTKIGTNAIETAKIKAGAIEAAKIATGAVEAVKIAAGAVVADKIGAGAVTTIKLDALAVTAAKIAALTISAGKIAANAIETGKIAALAVTADKIAAGTITADEIAAGTITAAEILAGTITADRLVLTQRVFWYSKSSANLRNSNNTTRTTTGQSYVKKKETRMREITGLMRVDFTIKSSNATIWAEARLYVNGSPYGPVRSTQSTSGETFIEAITANLAVNDLVQVYLLIDQPGYTASVWNLQFKYDRAVTVVAGAVLSTALTTVGQTALSMTNQDP